MARITIERVASHRNGVSGAPFHVVKFHEGKQPFLGVVFDESRHVAVFDRDLLAQDNIDFGTNSWRGDEYEVVLRRAVDDYCLAQQILPTERWSGGWSPITDPVSLPEGKALSKVICKSMGKLYGFPADEAPIFLRRVIEAVAQSEETEDGVNIYRTAAGEWINSSAPPADGQRWYGRVHGPDRPRPPRKARHGLAVVAVSRLTGRKA